MRRGGWLKRWGVPALAVLPLTVVATISLASQMAPPRTEPVVASFSATRVSDTSTVCVGENGRQHIEFERTWRGTSSSNEKSLTGNIEISGHGLFDLSQRVGTLRGTVSWTDPQSGATRASAAFDAVIDFDFPTGRAITRGLFRGSSSTISGTAPVTPTVARVAALVANFQWTSSNDQMITIQGQFSQGSGFVTALVQKGSCPGSLAAE